MKEEERKKFKEHQEKPLAKQRTVAKVVDIAQAKLEEEERPKREE